MSKLCYKNSSGTVKQYNLKSSAPSQKPYLCVKQSSGTIEYLPLKEGTKAEEICFRVGSKNYYTLHVPTSGNAMLIDDSEKPWDGYGVTGIHDRGGIGGGVIPFLNENRQIVAMIAYMPMYSDRQGRYIFMEDWKDKGNFTRANANNPGGTIKLCTWHHGIMGEISVGKIKEILKEDVITPIGSNVPSRIKTMISRANVRNNTVTKETDARVTTCYSHIGPWSYYGTDYKALADGTWFSNSNYSAYTSKVGSGTVYYTGKTYKGEGLNWDGFRPHSDTSYEITYEYCYSSSYGSNSAYSGLFLGANVSGFPIIATVSSKYANVCCGENCSHYCMAFIEYPGTQLLGVTPYSFLDAWESAVGTDVTFVFPESVDVIYRKNS